jgi:hypothetical protein
MSSGFRLTSPRTTKTVKDGTEMWSRGMNWNKVAQHSISGRLFVNMKVALRGAVNVEIFLSS